MVNPNRATVRTAVQQATFHARQGDTTSTMAKASTALVAVVYFCSAATASRIAAHQISGECQAGTRLPPPRANASAGTHSSTAVHSGCSRVVSGAQARAAKVAKPVKVPGIVPTQLRSE